MATDLIMPKSGLTMEEGTVVEWLAAGGERVEKGQPVVRIETDKVVIDVEAPTSGVLGQPLIEPGRCVPITTLLARIYAPDERIETDLVTQVPAAQAQIPATQAQVPAAQAQGTGSGRKEASDAPAFPQPRRKKLFSSPKARKVARDLGIDWKQLTGSGPGGRVIERDVRRAARAIKPGPAAQSEGDKDVIWQTPSSVQRVAAERMTASFTSTPHFYLNVDVWAGALLDLRRCLMPEVENRTGVRLTITDLLLKITAVALKEHPRLNAFWDEGRIGLRRQINVNLAIAGPNGLVAAVLRQLDTKTVSQVAQERVALVERARTNNLSPDDLSGGTFTLTNLGVFRVDSFQPILNPPQSAILAVGRITERAVVVRGQLQARPMATLSLACDHRVLDGAIGAQFLERVAELIEKPAGLLA